jgi:alanine racemase
VWINGKEARTGRRHLHGHVHGGRHGIACAAGDDAIVFNATHPVQEYARDLGTIAYEALTSISPRVKRVFVHGS